MVGRATPSTAVTTDVSADTVERLRLVVLRISRRIKSQSTGSLTPSQVTVLLTIAISGPLTIGEIAEFEQVKPPAASKIVTTLVERGLVARADDATDRRRSIVSATAEGQAFLHEFRAAGRTWLLGQIEQLDADDRESIDAALPALERLLAANGAPR